MKYDQETFNEADTETNAVAIHIGDQLLLVSRLSTLPRHSVPATELSGLAPSGFIVMKAFKQTSTSPQIGRSIECCQSNGQLVAVLLELHEHEPRSRVNRGYCRKPVVCTASGGRVLYDNHGLSGPLLIDYSQERSPTDLSILSLDCPQQPSS